jgi:hypothetical protein
MFKGCNSLQYINLLDININETLLSIVDRAQYKGKLLITNFDIRSQFE